MMFGSDSDEKIDIGKKSIKRGNHGSEGHTFEKKTVTLAVYPKVMHVWIMIYIPKLSSSTYSIYHCTILHEVGMKKKSERGKVWGPRVHIFFT